MGTVFSLYKRTPKQRYELGKPRHGYAPGLAPPEHTLNDKIKALTAAFQSIMGPPSAKGLSDHYTAMNSLIQPGWGAMWSIMGTPDYSVFKLSRFSVDQLADIMFRASQNIDTPMHARKVAVDMLKWSGDDDVTLNPEEPEKLRELGWPTRGYRDAGNIWKAMNG